MNLDDYDYVSEMRVVEFKKIELGEKTISQLMQVSLGEGDHKVEFAGAVWTLTEVELDDESVFVTLS